MYLHCTNSDNHNSYIQFKYDTYGVSNLFIMCKKIKILFFISTYLSVLGSRALAAVSLREINLLQFQKSAGSLNLTHNDSFQKLASIHAGANLSLSRGFLALLFNLCNVRINFQTALPLSHFFVLAILLTLSIDYQIKGGGG